MPTTDFRLGNCTVRPHRCCIERDDQRIRVKPKSMAVLERLAAGNGEVVSRDELFDAVWPGGIVSDDALTQCVVELRRAFGDSAKHPRIIETIPKIGFRLVPAIDRARPETTRIARLWLLPAAVVLLVAGAALMFLRPGPAEPSSVTSVLQHDKSLAVLPFVDMSPGKDQGHFADGLTVELLNRLARLEGLHVTGRTSAFHFKGSQDDPRTIADRLNVDHLLEGSVRRSDDRLRVSAQLIDVTNGFQLWSDQFDEPLEDVFAIQEEIAESVANALSIKLSVGRLGNIPGGTDSVEAYEALMQGDALMQDFTADKVEQAIGHLREAAVIDPDFAWPWLLLARAYRSAELLVGDDATHRWLAQADSALNRAERMMPDASAVLSTRIFLQAERAQWSAVERTFSRAGAQSAGNDVGLMFAYSDFLAKTGQAGEATLLMERLRRLDPLSSGVASVLGHVYAMQGRIDEALAHLEYGFDLGELRALISVEGLATALSGDDPREVRKWLLRAVQYQQPGAKGAHETMAGLLDDPEAAREWLQQAYEKTAIPEYYIGLWAAYLGDPQLALDAMRRSPTPWSFWLPVTAEVRRLPEFRTLMTEIGLESYWREYGWGDYCHPVGPEEFDCR